MPPDLGDSLQFLPISSKNLAWIPNHKHLHWVQSTKLCISATTCIEISKFWSVDLYEAASECTSVCPEFLGICQKHFHSASEAMSKYLLAVTHLLLQSAGKQRFSWSKIRSSLSYNISNSDWSSAGMFNFDFIMLFLLLEPLVNHVVFPRIAMKFRKPAHFDNYWRNTKFLNNVIYSVQSILHQAIIR